jgi:hypothetical protein
MSRCTTLLFLVSIFVLCIRVDSFGSKQKDFAGPPGHKPKGVEGMGLKNKFKKAEGALSGIVKKPKGRLGGKKNGPKQGSKGRMNKFKLHLKKPRLPKANKGTGGPPKQRVYTTHI